MKMVFFNKGGAVDVTPAGSGTFDITIDGTEYTQAFNSNVATTIDDFITAHGATINAAHSLVIVDGTSKITFYGLPLSKFSSDTATIAADLTKQVGVSADNFISYVYGSASAKTVAINVNAAASGSSFDLLTLTFPTAAIQSKFEDELREIQASNSGAYEFGLSCLAAFS